MGETWLPVPGFEFYEASDLGRVRSVDRNVASRWGTPKRVKGRVLKQVKTGRYLAVTLYQDGQPSAMLVHRLVLLAFVGPCPEGLACLHYDDDGRNNNLGNLRWGTPSENAHDCIRNGGNWKSNATHCKRGHEFTADNTYIVDGTGHRQCRACGKARKDAKRTVPHPRDRTHCPQGHPYNEANTWCINGRRVCKECGRTRSRERARRIAAEKRATTAGPK